MLNELNISNISRKSFFYIHKIVIYSSTILFFISLIYSFLNKKYLLSHIIYLKYIDSYILNFNNIYFFEIILLILLIINWLIDTILFKFYLKKYSKSIPKNEDYELSIKKYLNIHNFHMFGFIHTILCFILIPTFHLKLILVLNGIIQIYDMYIFCIYVICLIVVNTKQFLYSLYSVKDYTIF